MYRVIYKSRMTTQLTRDAVESIMNESRERNAENNISGVLLASETHFLQILEGPFFPLNETFCRINKDTRHDTMQIISFREISKRVFENWGMRGLGVLNLNIDLAKRLRAKYGEEEGGLRFPHTEWQALALFFDLNMITRIP
ncbi:BLUF domain-containing protein [Chitinivibrio alkaliphilus]|uniref:BLUF domain-containing protein n=1 Tax=Chitinivibrio alkaliphilus ACht1 TaxID=1313304 RepID=U7DCL4_9BACT|nr:BLUF domain-containing protein [Chitinivibrio alkaliphilus]ERP39288.1 hypothetical protein CALK_0080 [Chitinivibrio alkaliphilus ACht1]